MIAQQADTLLIVHFNLLHTTDPLARDTRQICGNWCLLDWLFRTWNSQMGLLMHCWRFLRSWTFIYCTKVLETRVLIDERLLMRLLIEMVDGVILVTGVLLLHI